MTLALPVAALLLRATPRSHVLASWLFFAGALSDLLDGYTARRLGNPTDTGGFLDPLADKLLIDTTLMALAWRGGFPVPLALALTGRDLAVTWLRAGRGASLHPSAAAKLKTALLYAGTQGLLTTTPPFVPSSFVPGSTRSRLVRRISWLCVVLATALSATSALDYARRR